MARNKQILIHYHTSTGNVETVKSEIRMGEIVVKHATEKPELYIKNDNHEIVTFIDSKAIENKLSVLKTDLEGQITAADGSAVSALTDFKAEVAETYATKEKVAKDIATAKSEAIGEASAYTDTQVSAAEGRVNTKITGVENDVTALTQTVADNKTAVDNKFNNYYTTGQTDDKISVAKSEAIGAASAYTDTQVSAAEGRVNTKITGVDNKVDTLIGSDIDKSVRAIALDEVSKGVAAVVSGAPEAFDTLKEIADWINAGSGATTADIVTDINNLKKADEELSGEITKVDNKVTALAQTVVDNKTAVDNKFKGYYTSAQTDTKISATKDAAIGEASAYTDTQVSAAEGRVNTKITGVENDVTALTQTVADNKTAVDNKFNNYYTTGQTDDKISVAKSEAIGAASAYTDTQVSAAEGRVNASIEGLDSRIDTLEGLSATTQSAVQTITVGNSEKHQITATKTETSVALNFDEMIIDCGEF